MQVHAFTWADSHTHRHSDSNKNKWDDLCSQQKLMMMEGFTQLQKQAEGSQRLWLTVQNPVLHLKLACLWQITIHMYVHFSIHKNRFKATFSRNPQNFCKWKSTLIKLDSIVMPAIYTKSWPCQCPGLQPLWQTPDSVTMILGWLGSQGRRHARSLL